MNLSTGRSFDATKRKSILLGVVLRGKTRSRNASFSPSPPSQYLAQHLKGLAARYLEISGRQESGIRRA